MAATALTLLLPAFKRSRTCIPFTDSSEKKNKSSSLCFSVCCWCMSQRWQHSALMSSINHYYIKPHCIHPRCVKISAFNEKINMSNTLSGIITRRPGVSDRSNECSYGSIGTLSVCIRTVTRLFHLRLSRCQETFWRLGKFTPCSVLSTSPCCLTYDRRRSKHRHWTPGS